MNLQISHNHSPLWLAAIALSSIKEKTQWEMVFIKGEQFLQKID